MGGEELVLSVDSLVLREVSVEQLRSAGDTHSDSLFGLEWVEAPGVSEVSGLSEVSGDPLVTGLSGVGGVVVLGEVDGVWGFVAGCWGV